MGIAWTMSGTKSEVTNYCTRQSMSPPKRKRHVSGRISAMLGPAQIDTCTEDLLMTTLAAAGDHGWKVHTHAAQSLVEFYEMTRRHGMTPVQWANDIGAART